MNQQGKDKVNKMFRYYFDKAWQSYLIRGLLLLVVILGLLWHFREVTLGVIIPAMIGFIISKFIISAIQTWRGQREDQAKSISCFKKINEIYKDEKPITITINNTSTQIYIQDLMEGKKLEPVLEFKNEVFELTPFIQENIKQLMDAHLMSHIMNGNTLRLCDVTLTNDQIIFKTCKTDYYKHLVTNRAVDYPITKHLTLRKIYEPGPKLKPFNESSFSNHIGLDMIVILSDGYTICPKRRNDATYSKNKITSSVAMGYRISEYSKVSFDDMKESLLKKAKQRLKLPDKILNHIDQINFLGASKSLYEGGKPQFHFILKLSDYTVQDYMKDVITLKIKKFESDIDEDKRLYLISLKDISLLEDYKMSTYHYENGKKHKKQFIPELSFYMSMYYYHRLK